MVPPIPPDPPSGPIRTCIGCRERRSQDQLDRFGRRGDGSLAKGRTLMGRGAWLCQESSTCLDLAVRRNGFSRAFRAPVSATALAELRSVLAADQGS